MNIGEVQAQFQALQTDFKKVESRTDKKASRAYSSNNPRIREVFSSESKETYSILEKVNLDSSKVNIKDLETAQKQLSTTTDLMRHSSKFAIKAQARANPESVLQVLSKD